MKSFSKRVASFTMAAAMVLSLAAVSPVDAQAAKKASITKKTSITAGKTYTYKIKNVTSKQYVKVTGITSGVTVKYNNKTVKKNSTKIYGKKSGAALALKVTAKDKVANYKATIKAQVYNKSNNKKVGSLLKTTTKVKCTKLEVTSVESASTTGKYLVATFNKALSKLSVADVTIKNQTTGELKGVSKVDLSSDGKSATITLVGSEDAINNSFVEPNIDYTFTVAQSGATATTVFTVDAVEANVTVVSVDAGKRTIKVSQPLDKNTNTAGGATNGATIAMNTGSTVTVPAEITCDFQKLLGTTVTVKYNKNNVVTSLKSANEKVFITTLKTDTNNTQYVIDAATGDKYYLQADSGDLKQTQQIAYNSTGVVPAAPYGQGANTKVDYAKVVLYANGSVKTVVTDAAYTGSLLVSKVDGTVVYAGKDTAENLKDFKIVKDGATATIADISEKDVVFFDRTNKFADIYTVSEESDIQAAYKDTFKFKDVTYKYSEVDPAKAYQVKYVDGSVKNMDGKVMDSYLAGGPKATVYFNRAKQPVFVVGTPKAAEKTNEVTLMLTKDAVTYNSILKDYIRLTGFDGKESKTYDISVADLKKLRISTGSKYSVDSAVTSNAANASAWNAAATEGTVTGFSIDGTAVKAYTNYKGAPTTYAYNSMIDFTNDLKIKDMVVLTLTEAGAVKEINLKDGIALSNVATDKFKGGETNITAGIGTTPVALQISGTTPVYVSSNNAQSKVDYSAFASQADGDKTVVYTNDGKNVSYVFVESTTAATINYVEGVVAAVNYKPDGKLADLKILTGTIESELFTSFDDADNVIKATVSVGQIVVLGLSADGKKVQAIEKGSHGAHLGSVSTNMHVSTNTVNTSNGTFHVSSNNVAVSGNFTLATSGKVTIVELVTEGNIPTLKTLNFAELAALDSTTNEVTISTLGDTSFIDTIVVTKRK